MKKLLTIEEYEDRVGPKRRNAFGAFIALIAITLGVFVFGDSPPPDYALFTIAMLGILVLLFAWYPYMKVVTEIRREIKDAESTEDKH